MEFKFGRNKFSFDGVKNFPPTETVQDDALSLREILIRFSNGQPLPPVAMEAYYPNEEPSIDDMPLDISSLDMVELDSYKNSVENHIMELQAKLQTLQELSQETEQPSAELNIVEPNKTNENEQEKETPRT